MTISTLISKIKKEKPNTFSDTDLLSYLNEVESEAFEQVNKEFSPYEEVDDTVLLAPAPYDRLYVSYVKAQIDYANEEYASYQNNANQHTQDFRDFADWVVRTGQSTENAFPANYRNILY